MHTPEYDIVVIGGGHAGIEAASAAARMGCRTLLVTMSRDAIGRLSCNPAIGGMAKGQLVREIDALGGEMARLADAAGLQFKMLGRSKGPAMWSPRAQVDKDQYPVLAQRRLATLDGLEILEDQCQDVVVRNGSVEGVLLVASGVLPCRSVIICSGTFLAGKMHIGLDARPGGRFQEEASVELSGSLRSVGFHTGRLKTGTPPRIERTSIDVGICRADGGDYAPVPFSRATEAVANTVTCYLTETTEETHRVLRTGFDRSPMFTGRIEGIGPRYCPSIEDKVERFADRPSHQIFLEPEGAETESVYVNGFSTSLPADVQLSALRTIPPLADCRVIRYGYAVEYDYFPSYQLDGTLQSKRVAGLYFAGQVNGTSGYEEAAAQGLMAGINAALRIKGEEPFLLKRSDAYIGVLLDDLANLTIEEPYRMFTSRAEYRLLLRQDNADLRLTPSASRLGLIDGVEAERVRTKGAGLARARSLLEVFPVEPSPGRPHSEMTKAWQLLKRTDVDVAQLHRWIADATTANTPELLHLLANEQIVEQLEIAAKYDGYIERQRVEIGRFVEMEETIIPEGLDFHRIRSLSSEAREKLDRIRPRSLGQASRIAGVSRSDLGVLTMVLR